MNFLIALFLLVGQVPRGALPYSISTGPSLSCTHNESNNTANLTTTGTTDWIQWNQSVVERKSTGGSQISTYTVVGGGTPVNQTTAYITVSWSDGTPDASGSVTTGLLNARSANNQGFSFTCPASTTSHTCIGYLPYHIGAATFVAHLSDSSAADFTYHAPNTGGNVPEVFTCSYKAASAAQTVTYTWTSDTFGSQGVIIQGAAYQ